ncbi:ABC transporter ATP-binding protein/permease [Phyllobacterium endophyticum]|uniref:ABC transporter ATP-binding protein n=1 Tax=Phyllobacterium endophyticum TaxID=1149773 RepID=A0A2P7B1X8_9HYPH|nr:ATP-binding cassette domain-containing protein [Phyllobacterium endophyticum]MBB3238059.1 putative ATP-binding cassette transporter [Phyllobacterium endophyticum]PSH60473.1 ABC transporter ATP-binding protein [Phyllobacterium endophyticum]TYR42649.1 ABC transporter ATP-binding protein/permease [Phyllobacterium endophyticum]
MLIDTAAAETKKLADNPAEYRLNRLFFLRLWRLWSPYWKRPEARKSWLIIAVAVLTIAVGIPLQIWQSYTAKDLTNALIAKNAAEYWPLLILETALTALLLLLSVGMRYLTGRVELQWRQWLAAHLSERYLARRTYYAITQDNSIDNPDQRIQQETIAFCSTMLSLPFIAIGAIATMITQMSIMGSISTVLSMSVVSFAIFQSIVTFKLFQPTIKQQFDITVAEADLRYGLLNVRDNAETIAFYQGEHAEQQHILRRLGLATHKRLISLVYGTWVTLSNGGMSVAWAIVPVLCLVPQYLAGAIDYGTIAQSTFAATSLLGALTIFVDLLPHLSSSFPGIARLAQIDEKVESLGVDQSIAGGRILRMESALIVIDKMTLATPGGERVLVRDLSLQVRPGHHLIIIGQTGLGKSALLRAIAGLWNRGSGAVALPPSGETLFLPQRPYMFLGDLRSQLVYPAIASSLDDAELQAILDEVQLSNVATRHGGFDAIKDWSRILSLGEQQRIAIARVLIARPRFVFLDEATSAVDSATEKALYAALQRSGSTLVSVGHRQDLLAYHTDALRLLPGGAFELLPAHLVRPTSGEIDAA